jgi:HAD superfamily phosphatase (TIGR01668 family)
MASDFHPDCYVSSLGMIDPGRLKEAGIRLVLLDNDNTIGSSLHEKVSSDASEFVARLKANHLHVMILSNNFSVSARQKAAQLGLTYFGFCLKPLKHSFQRAMMLYGVRPEECVMIGDQVITDICGAKRCHMHTILIDRVDEKDHIFGYMTRLVSYGVKCFVKDIPAEGEYYGNL